MSLIIVSFKVVQALNVYINKNSKWYTAQRSYRVNSLNIRRM
jgi:hypothetical protein